MKKVIHTKGCSMVLITGSRLKSRSVAHSGSVCVYLDDQAFFKINIKSRTQPLVCYTYTIQRIEVYYRKQFKS